MNKRRIGVLGAASMVGDYVLQSLADDGNNIVAFSRNQRKTEDSDEQIEWCLLEEVTEAHSDKNNLIKPKREIKEWISLISIWVLSDYFSILESCGAKRVVVLSSTSRFTKTSSSDKSEQKLAERISAAEDQFIRWAQLHKIEWNILQPTLIYDPGKDKNITEISGFIRRFGFFPLFGAANGLRQPIHAEDVAHACCQVLESQRAVNRSYIIPGSETLTYREMVGRIFSVMGMRQRFLKIPLVLFRLAVFILRMFPRFRNWSAAMAERMNQDMVFEETAAANDFGFSARPFKLEIQAVKVMTDRN